MKNTKLSKKKKQVLSVVLVVLALAGLGRVLQDPEWHRSYREQTILEDYDQFTFVEYSPRKAQSYTLTPSQSEGNWPALEYTLYGVSGQDLVVHCVYEMEERGPFERDMMVLWYGVVETNHQWKLIAGVQDVKKDKDPWVEECVSNATGDLSIVKTSL